MFNKFLFLILGGCILMFSCNRFLDVDPKDQISADALWTSEDNVELFLNSIYAQIPDKWTSNDPLENFSDNAMSGVPGWPSISSYRIGVYNPSSPVNFGADWSELYAAIRRCNLMIENVRGSDSFDDADWISEIVGEARFLRGYFYHLLWLQYGGVPIITVPLNRNEMDEEELFNERNTDDETYQFIVDELAEIAPDLEVNVEDGKASRGAALTLKAWCDLNYASPYRNPSNDRNRWKTAADSYKAVMDLNKYDLFPEYGEMFFEVNNGNTETIFAKQHLGGGPFGSSKEGYQGPWRAGGTQRAWGTVDPTQEMVDEYFMDNGLPITDPASGYDPQNPYENREKRFYESIVYDGSMWLGYEIITRKGEGSQNAIDQSDANEATNTGYYLKKGLNPEFAINGGNQLSSADYIIFRYARVLLGYAEAQNEILSSPDQSIYDAINTIRDRVDLPPLPTGLTQDEMRETIQQERRVELAFEDIRTYDLLRLKLAETIMNETSHGMLIETVGGKRHYTVVPAASGQMHFDASMNYLLPIPQGVRDQNEKIDQNPHYDD